MCHVRCRLEHLANAEYDLLYTPFPPNAPARHCFRSGLIALYYSNTNTAGVVVAVEPHLASTREANTEAVAHEKAREVHVKTTHV